MYIPTYEECNKIVENNDTFIKKEVVIDGYTIVIFNYRLASYSDFADNNAHELRGITFVLNHDGTVYKRYLMLHKFFCLDQTLGYMLSDVKDKKIIRAQHKFDGSMIRFIKLPNGKVIAKTKYDLTNEFTTLAENVYNSNADYKKLIDYTLDNNLAAIFELVSPFNKVVVNYSTTDLCLLQFRNENDGNYFGDLDIFIKVNIANDLNIKIANELDICDINTYVNDSKKSEGIEGWVITFEDSQMIKIKTDWYKSLHRLLTEDITNENWIISSILDETIDDAITNLGPEQNEIRNHVESIINKFNKWFNSNVIELTKIANSYSGNRKEFAIAHKNDEYFGVLMQLISSIEKGSKIDEDLTHFLMKKYILKITTKLNDAKKLLDNI